MNFFLSALSICYFWRYTGPIRKSMSDHNWNLFILGFSQFILGFSSDFSSCFPSSRYRAFCQFLWQLKIKREWLSSVRLPYYIIRLIPIFEKKKNTLRKTSRIFVFLRFLSFEFADNFSVNVMSFGIPRFLLVQWTYGKTMTIGL